MVGGRAKPIGVVIRGRASIPSPREVTPVISLLLSASSAAEERRRRRVRWFRFRGGCLATGLAASPACTPSRARKEPIRTP